MGRGAIDADLRSPSISISKPDAADAIDAGSPLG
jgi:hypothetical protein